MHFSLVKAFSVFLKQQELKLQQSGFRRHHDVRDGGRRRERLKENLADPQKSLIPLWTRCSFDNYNLTSFTLCCCLFFFFCLLHDEPKEAADFPSCQRGTTCKSPVFSWLIQGEKKTTKLISSSWKYKSKKCILVCVVTNMKKSVVLFIFKNVFTQSAMNDTQCPVRVKVTQRKDHS